MDDTIDLAKKAKIEIISEKQGKARVCAYAKIIINGKQGTIRVCEKNAKIIISEKQVKTRVCEHAKIISNGKQGTIRVCEENAKIIISEKQGKARICEEHVEGNIIGKGKIVSAEILPGVIIDTPTGQLGGEKEKGKEEEK